MTKPKSHSVATMKINRNNLANKYAKQIYIYSPIQMGAYSYGYKHKADIPNCASSGCKIQFIT